MLTVYGTHHTLAIMDCLRAMNSDSIVDIAIIDYLIDLHATAPPSSVNT